MASNSKAARNGGFGAQGCGQILQREEGTQGHVGFVVSTVGRIVTVCLNCYGLAPPQPFSGLGKFRLQSLGLSGAYGRYLQHSFMPSCGENILASMGAIGPLFWSFSPLLRGNSPRNLEPFNPKARGAHIGV